MNVQSVPLRTAPRKKTSVMVAILTGRERHFWLNPELLGVCMRMIFWQNETKSRMEFRMINSFTPVDAARNEAVKQLLQSNNEWLLQIDNDVVPPPNVLAILDDIADRKIVGLPCGIEKRPGELTLALGHKVRSESSENPYESYTGLPSGWAQIDVMGTGCFFTHRDVYSAIAYPWYECYVSNTAHTGEDFSFCDKARDAGFTIWTHSSFPCAHFKTVDLTQHMVAKHGPLVR